MAISTELNNLVAETDDSEITAVIAPKQLLESAQLNTQVPRSVHAGRLEGCYSCQEGSKVNISCYSAISWTDVLCAHRIFSLECGPSNQLITVKIVRHGSGQFKVLYYVWWSEHLGSSKRHLVLSDIQQLGQLVLSKCHPTSPASRLVQRPTSSGPHSIRNCHLAHSTHDSRCVYSSSSHLLTYLLGPAVVLSPLSGGATSRIIRTLYHGAGPVSSEASSRVCA